MPQNPLTPPRTGNYRWEEQHIQEHLVACRPQQPQHYNRSPPRPHESCLRPLQTSHAGLERMESSFSSWPADVVVLLVGNSVYRIFFQHQHKRDQLARQEWDVSSGDYFDGARFGWRKLHSYSLFPDIHTVYSANCSGDSLITREFTTTCLYLRVSAETSGSCNHA